MLRKDKKSEWLDPNGFKKILAIEKADYQKSIYAVEPFNPRIKKLAEILRPS